MRRVHLRGHTNIRKRLLIHADGFNLGLLMRQLTGVGTPRGLQGRVTAALVVCVVLIHALWRRSTHRWSLNPRVSTLDWISLAPHGVTHVGAGDPAFTTG